MIKDVKSVYTGGNIWLFYGVLDDGTYFLVDDFGAVRITDDKWDDFDRSLFNEWQEEHLVRDIEDEDERIAFCNEMLDRLYEEEGTDGGFDEYDAYRKYFAEPI